MPGDESGIPGGEGEQAGDAAPALSHDLTPAAADATPPYTTCSAGCCTGNA